MHSAATVYVPPPAAVVPGVADVALFTNKRASSVLALHAGSEATATGGCKHGAPTLPLAAVVDRIEHAEVPNT